MLYVWESEPDVGNVHIESLGNVAAGADVFFVDGVQILDRGFIRFCQVGQVVSWTDLIADIAGMNGQGIGGSADAAAGFFQFIQRERDFIPAPF